MPYKHRVVEGLAELIDRYGGGGKDPFMRALWYGIKGQIPHLLSSIDNSPEAVKQIEDKLREVLGIEPPTVIEEPTPEEREEATVKAITIIEDKHEADKEPPKKVRAVFSGTKTPGKRRKRVTEEPAKESNGTTKA